MITVIMGSVAFAGGRKPRRLARGEWGAPHISIEVSANSATIQYDCAHGEIKGPLVIDSRGRFNLKGTHTPESPGPIRVNRAPATEPARYTGWTDGKRMTLTISLIDRKETVGTFELTLGGVGRVFRCR